MGVLGCCLPDLHGLFVLHTATALRGASRCQNCDKLEKECPRVSGKDVQRPAKISEDQADRNIKSWWKIPQRMIEDQISLETVFTLGDWPDKPNFTSALACFPLLPAVIHLIEYGEIKLPSILALSLVYTGHSSGCLLPCNTQFVFIC